MKMLLIGGIAVWALSVSASEVVVTAAEVPTQVIDAVMKKYPGASLRSFERETKASVISYEVALEITRVGAKPRRLDVDVTEDGTVLSEEELISIEEVPMVVRKAFEAWRYSKLRVVQIERAISLRQGAQPKFEIVAHGTGEIVEAVFDSEGSLLKEKQFTKEQIARWEKEHGL